MRVIATSCSLIRSTNPRALGFYRAAGFTDCGVAQTAFGTSPRMVLILG